MLNDKEGDPQLCSLYLSFFATYQRSFSDTYLYIIFCQNFVNAPITGAGHVNESNKTTPSLLVLGGYTLMTVGSRSSIHDWILVVPHLKLRSL